MLSREVKLIDLQKGVTLIELLIAMVISLIVSTAMVMLMANTMSSGTQTIQMTRLTQDLRAAIQIMSRDLRRSSYTSEAIQCFANPACGSNGTLSLPGAIIATDNCLIFQLDRAHDGNAINDQGGAFRRRVIGTGLAARGVIEIWSANGSPASCTAGAAASWVQITEPNVVDITELRMASDFVRTGSAWTATTTPLSYAEVIMTTAAGATTQTVRKVQFRLSGEMINSISDFPVRRTIEDMIRVRNNIVTSPP